MTPKSFFNIVLKIFGLFFLKELLNTIPELISTIAYFQKGESGEGIYLFVMYILIIGFYVFIISQLLFKTNGIIHRLKLDSGFSEEVFGFKFDQTQVFTVSLIVIGGVLLLTGVPNLVREIFVILQQNKEMHGAVPTDYSFLLANCARIIIALLLIGERKRIVEMMENKKVQNGEEDESGAI